MKGGFNKILRNIVAGASDTEYEKVSERFPISFTLSDRCFYRCRDSRKLLFTWIRRNRKKNTSSVSFRLLSRQIKKYIRPFNLSVIFII